MPVKLVLAAAVLFLLPFRVRASEGVISGVGGGICKTDDDCVPSSCCHPTTCGTVAPDCSTTSCLRMCQPGSLDCGQGRCACDPSTLTCNVVWAQPLHQHLHAARLPAVPKPPASSAGHCTRDSDCVPATCCSPTDCVHRESPNRPDCTDVRCPLVCTPGTLDCGQGKCQCDPASMKCDVRWHLPKKALPRDVTPAEN
jgi:hypothetical protein